jgi:hypothetical protein
MGQQWDSDQAMLFWLVLGKFETGKNVGLTPRLRSSTRAAIFDPHSVFHEGVGNLTSSLDNLKWIVGMSADLDANED